MTSRSPANARAYLASLVGHEIKTLTGRPNRIVCIDGENVIVATSRSPEGKPVPIKAVQAAIEALERDGELLINVKTVGYRSAFIGAVLASMPATRTAVAPFRVTRTD